jgi:NAD(P)-dependent dehydrogenase (short-subunit alcohol dehydrogenase family)
MSTCLLGRVALVTGAAGDLGRGITTALAAHGATVLCADIRETSDLAEALPDNRGRAVTLDVTDADAVDHAISELDDEYRRFDILVNNAGLSQPPTPLVDTSNAIVDRLLDVNVKGVLYCARAAARAMVRHGSGRIINIASQAGKCGVANWAVYCASKAAVVAATQAQALELAEYGITVNAICPGPMLTEMTRKTVRLEAEATGVDSAQLLEAQGRAVPVGRYGTAADLGAMLVWIASDQSSFTTGASFNLTGGTSVFF